MIALDTLKRKLADYASTLGAYDHQLTEDDKLAMRRLEHQKLAMFKKKDRLSFGLDRKQN